MTVLCDSLYDPFPLFPHERSYVPVSVAATPTDAERIATERVPFPPALEMSYVCRGERVRLPLTGGGRAREFWVLEGHEDEPDPGGAQ